MSKFGVGIAVLVLAGAGHAQVTERMSVNAAGSQGNFGGDTSPGVSISADGRWVAFMSRSTNLIPGDTNATWDIFVRDRRHGTTRSASVDSAGAQGNGFSGLFGIWVSADGRFVVFESIANNLVPGDTNGCSDIFVHDLESGATERASVASSGIQGNGSSLYPSLSADGRFIAFTSDATNLVPGDTNGFADTFVRDRVSGTTERVSVSSAGAQANQHGYRPAISADGRVVAFESNATNLVPGDTNGRWDVFVHDRLTGTTECVSRATGGAFGNGDSTAAFTSADGRCVVFTSSATNLVPGDTNNHVDAFLYDRVPGSLERVSVATGGAEGDLGSAAESISADARYVSFGTAATNFVPGGPTTVENVFVRDRLNATTQLVTVAVGGAATNGNSFGSSMSPDARYFSFYSEATNLVPGDTNTWGDVFFHDRDATGFTSLCEPGTPGVIACPCSNSPAGPDRGCDNSSSSGGASLAASGIAYLSLDSLLFTTSYENPTATSILLQGNASIPNGLVFGQGVRCAGGRLVRLFVKHAVAGTITAPDFAAGDPTVSARSAARGDPIRPGESRWYLVYYRDPIVLGGCSASSQFNGTQTGAVTWWP